MNKQLACWAFLAMSVIGPWRAHAEFVVEVTKGQTEAIPIAIVPFASAELAAASFDVAQLVSDDLARSGRFKAMDRKDMIEQPHSGTGISFDDWRRLNNDYMVVGSMTSDATDHYSITYELYNVLTKQRLLGFQISSNRPGLRSSDRLHIGAGAFAQQDFSTHRGGRGR
jgi:TolB protein